MGMTGCGGGGGGETAAPPPSSVGSPAPAPAPAPAPPAITSAATAALNDGFGGVFYAARATVPSGHAVVWSLSGADAAQFTVDAATGSLSFKAAPNVESPADAGSDNRYDVVLTATDGALTAIQALQVTVNAWNKGGASALPAPVVAVPVAQPTGSVANLKVLPWAGFSSAVSYSFDDSSPSQIDHWPDLKAQNVRSTFYVNPSGNWYAGYDAAMQDAVAKGNEIGNHTYHHCAFADLGGANLAACSAGWSVDQEMDDTTSYIKSHFGQSDVWTTAYPFGDLGYQAAAQARFFIGRSVNPGFMASGDTLDPFALQVVAHAGDPTPVGGDPVSVFNADLDASASQGKWTVFLFHTLLPTTNNWGLGEGVAAVTGSMQYAKGLGTVWIDSVVNIGAYWIGQKLVTNASVASSGSTKTWSWVLPPHFPPGRVLRVTVDGGSLSQGGKTLAWDGHGYYEVALDAGSLAWAP